MRIFVPPSVFRRSKIVRRCAEICPRHRHHDRPRTPRGTLLRRPASISGEPGSRIATYTMTYGEPAIERIARVAFDLAMKRRKKVLSVDKANVLECSRLWREVVTRCAKDYSGVQLSHMYVDSAAMSLVQRPKDFDVVLTEICSATFSRIKPAESWAR